MMPLRESGKGSREKNWHFWQLATEFHGNDEGGAQLDPEKRVYVHACEMKAKDASFANMDGRPRGIMPLLKAIF